MIYTAKQLSSRHPEYEKKHERWEFFYNSFNGGEYYAAGQYLTRYVYEVKDEDYFKRIKQTPFDNHCRSVIEIYNSFLFGNEIDRDLNNLVNDEALHMFLEDADFEGRNINDFMKEAHTLASIYGNSWIIIDKPTYQASTRAEEIMFGVRPYANLISPLNVVNWNYSRTDFGWYELDFLQVLESCHNDRLTYRIYTKESTDVVSVEKNGRNLTVESSTPQTLGYIPAVCLYATRSNVKGIGVSDINDIADINRAIYDETSEIEQLIRLSNHPSLVKTAGTRAGAGAGAIITFDENVPADYKPYLLQPDSQSLDGIRASIQDKIESIDRIAHIGSVRNTQTRTISGVAMDSEFRLLESKLCGRAKNLALAEEQMFKIWCDWQAVQWDGEIAYPDTFNIKDKSRELELIKQGKEILSMPPVAVPEVEKALQISVIDYLFDDRDLYNDLTEEMSKDLATNVVETEETASSNA